MDKMTTAAALVRRQGPRSPWKTRYFLDTEFTDFNAFQLISVAIVGEDGREFYGESRTLNAPMQ
ncbi:hypothetical protein [Paraburkholderia sp.]|uniref:hypothetical protein n=1 Tax=Paraburkholderia sp. TaxID=1926495 RepID=UPI00238A76A8|nr:hypothetical protein [Paraburkholderia sp.]MDE1181494.1 hypothetical protein [Paraburkholderia sp.]